jgi:TonB-dependent receptor
MAGVWIQSLGTLRFVKMFVTHFFEYGVSGVKHLLRMAQKIYPASPVFAAAFCCAIGVTVTSGATAVRKSYDVQGGDAAATLTQFARHSGCQIAYLVENVRGEKTQPVRGEYVALDALRVMLGGTALFVVQDESTGALVVSRKRPSPAQNEPGESDRSRGPPAAAPAPPPNTPKTNQPKHTESPTMKKRTLFSALAGWLLAGAAVDAQTTGSIEGRVYNKSASTALVNARISLSGPDGSGSGRQSNTDSGGAYMLANIPPGEVRITVSYVGMETSSAAVTIPAGGTIKRDFELILAGEPRSGEVVKLEAFNVISDREMSAQAVAMNEQRSAPNLKNVVAMDQFGDRGSENIGNFLQFLPGVTVVTSGIEPFSISLRGLPSSSTGLMIDGASVASTQDERSPNLRAVPMANLSRVEVTKVPTPDVPANGLGGTINLISKTGFESRKRLLTFQLYELFHSSNGLTLKAGPRAHLPQNTYQWKQPSFDVNYIQPISKTLAITVGGARTWRMVPWASDNDVTSTWNLVDKFQRTSQWSTLVQLNKTLSGQFGIDWQIRPADTLSLSYHQRSYELPISRSTRLVDYGVGATGGPDYTQGAANAVGSATQGLDWRVEGYRTEQLSLKYRHRGPTWRIDAAGSRSTSGAFVNDIEEGTFRTANSVLANVAIRGDGTSLSGGMIPTRYSAVSSSGQTVDINDGGLYSIPSALSNQSRRTGSVEDIRIDLARDFKSGLALKVGAAVNRTNSDFRGFSKTWNFRPNGASDVTSRRAGNFDVFNTAFLNGGPTIFGVPYREISLTKLFDLYRIKPDWFVLDEPAAYQNRVTNSREYTEMISAGYVRTDVRLFNSRLWIVSGLRFEQTAGEGRGALDDINAQYQRNSAGNYVLNSAGQRVLITSDTLALRKLRFVERGAFAERTYRGVYPSINATYSLTENLLLRTAYARTIGRPNFNFITPGVTISAPDAANPIINVSNVGLRPWTADNYDLTVESYNLKGGVGSVGFFQKNISNFFGSTSFAATPERLAQYSIVDDGSFGNYQIVTRQNVGDAKVTGMEIGYRQSLNFLPTWASGLQVFANYTKLGLSGSTTADFAGFNPETISGGVNLLRSRYSIKVTYSHQAEARGALVAPNAAQGIPENTYGYQGKQSRWNVNMEYSLSRRLSLFATVADIGGFDFQTRRYAPSTPEYARNLRRMRMGSFTTLGIKGSF